MRAVKWLPQMAWWPALLLWAGSAGAAYERRTPVVEAVDRASPSVVNISTERVVHNMYDDRMLNSRNLLLEQLLAQAAPELISSEPRHSLGSGVVVDPAGYILTNFHVIERASRIRVKLADDSLHEAVFIAGDPVNDLALIRIDAARGLPAVAFARNDDLLLGETVIAVGNPFGLAHTVTVGVLSAKNREFRYGGNVLYKDILQTDAAINPGSSGGPLLNINGELIGINVSVNEEAQNIGFAVPIRRVRNFLARSLSPLLLRKMWLGFEPALTEEGVEVQRVAPGTAAERAGLQSGDQILTINDTPATDLYTFNRALLDLPTGVVVRLGARGVAGARSMALPFEAMPKPSGPDLAWRLLGVRLSAERDPLAAMHPLYRSGLPITELRPDSPLARAGVRPGLLITRVNEFEIRSLDDVGQALEAVKRGDPVELAILAVIESDAYIVHRQQSLRVAAL